MRSNGLLMSPVLVDYMGNFVRVALLAPTVLRDRPDSVVSVAQPVALRLGGRGVQPGGLCAGVVCHARGAFVARGASARGVHVVCRTDRRAFAGRGRACFVACWAPCLIACGVVALGLGLGLMAFMNMTDRSFQLLGCDFTSAPSRRKPITLAVGHVGPGAGGVAIAGDLRDLGRLGRRVCSAKLNGPGWADLTCRLACHANW